CSTYYCNSGTKNKLEKSHEKGESFHGSFFVGKNIRPLLWEMNPFRRMRATFPLRGQLNLAALEEMLYPFTPSLPGQGQDRPTALLPASFRFPILLYY
ncbi:hypothetical protein, partial [Dialister hominis]|uniref:hypothetical protein n=1 Tax=Dialister hominis TaxID=2582419 RepID=UPI003FD8EC00